MDLFWRVDPSLLYPYILRQWILHCGIWTRNLPAEQFHRISITHGGPSRRRRWLVTSHIGQGRKRVPTICSEVARVQVLDGLHEGNLDWYIYDFLFDIRCPGILAYSIDVLLRIVLYDHEATNPTHVQAQIRPDQLWEGKI